MRADTRKNTLRLAAIALFASITLLLISSVGLAMGMSHHGMGTMAGCPFMVGNDALCPVGIVEQLATWQQSFQATFTRTDSSMSFLINIFLAFAVLYLVALYHAHRRQNLAHAHAMKARQREYGFVLPITYLFSEGILHPKIYPVVI